MRGNGPAGSRVRSAVGGRAKRIKTGGALTELMLGKARAVPRVWAG